MGLRLIACAALALSATVSPSYADDFENAQMVALSVDPLRCGSVGGMTIDCHRISGLHEGFFIEGSQIDDVHHQLELFVPNGRRRDATAIASGACAVATDSALSWDSPWLVQVVMNGEIAAQCEIARRHSIPPSLEERLPPQKPQRAPPSVEPKPEPRSNDAAFDTLLKNLAKRDQATPDSR
jgi:hypothetical protein